MIQASVPEQGRLITFSRSVAVDPQADLQVELKVRSTTGIGESTVSASSAAVELAEKIFEDLSGRKAVLLDAGHEPAPHALRTGAPSTMECRRLQAECCAIWWMNACV